MIRAALDLVVVVVLWATLRLALVGIRAVRSRHGC